MRPAPVPSTRNASARLGVVPLAGGLGAEISGVDLATDLTDDVVAELRRIWLEHLVVFFRDQTLGPDEFLAFARRLGEPVEYPFIRGIDGYPEIISVTKLPHETVNFGGIWHSDTVYLDRPPMATMLIAREVPSSGGDTMWADMYTAFETLSPGLQRLLDEPDRGQQLGARRRLEDEGGPHPRRGRRRRPRVRGRPIRSSARTPRPGAGRST